MSSSIQLFNYGGNKIRTVIQNNEVWFVAKDVCDVLGLKNSRKAVNELYDNEKNTVTISDGNRGNPNTTIINEPGLYKLIFKSRKAEAKKFQDWIFYEVLPDIRKHGMYMTDNVKERAKANPDDFQRLLGCYLNATKEIKALKAELKENAPYTTLGKVVMSLPGSITVSDAAQFLRQHGIDIGRNGLYKYGRENGYLSVQKKRWNKPTQKGIDSGIVNLELDNGQFVLSTRTMITTDGLMNIFNEFFSEEYPLAVLFEAENEERRK